MIEQLTTASNMEEIGKIFLEFWDHGTELDSFSAVEINEFRKILLNRNLIGLAKKLTPPETFEFNRFNLTRAVLSEIAESSFVHQKLKFALWHRLITNKTISFMAKTTSPETINKLNLLLVSLKSVGSIKKPLTKNDQAKRYVILADLASQLGYEMFSLMAAKKSAKTDPDFVDAAIFVGRAYLELGSLYARRVGKTPDLGTGTFQYNLQKSSEVFAAALNKLTGSQRQQVGELITSIGSVLTEIEKQKRIGKHSVVHVVVEDYIKDKMEKVENVIMSDYENSDLKFAANVHPAETLSGLLSAAAADIDKDILETGDTLTVIKEITADTHRAQPVQPPKTGKLFNVYNQQSGFKTDTGREPEKMPDIPKAGSVTSDEIGYKIKLEDILKERIKEKNDEIFNKKS